MRKTGFIFVFLCLAFTVSGNDPDKYFREGNEHYKKSNFDSAITNYNAALKSGSESTELYYNLGNAYFKKKAYPKAILNYERALKLSPDDEDIIFNLSIANLFVVDKIVPLPALFYVQWFDAIRNIFSESGWSVLAVIMIWLAGIFAILFLWSSSVGLRKLFFYFSFFTMILFFIGFFFAWKQNSFLESDKHALVFEPSVYVKSSPDEKGVDLFILHEGVKVKVLDVIGNWKRIRLSNGNQGWVKAEILETI